MCKSVHIVRLSHVFVYHEERLRECKLYNVVVEHSFHMAAIFIRSCH